VTAREMQRRSAQARWSGLSAAERKAKMSALAKVRWAKTVRDRLGPGPMTDAEAEEYVRQECEAAKRLGEAEK